jgi:hypothetical protein
MEIKPFGSGYLVSVGNISAFGMSVAEAQFHLVSSGVVFWSQL